MCKKEFKPLPLVHNYLEKWAEETPKIQAVIQYEEGTILNYEQLNELVDLYALKLVQIGIRKGDRVAGICLHCINYLALQYACFKIGAIICPLDIKLKPQEIVEDLTKIKPRLLLILADKIDNNMHAIVEKVQKECSYVNNILQFNLNDSVMLIPGAENADVLFDIKALRKLAQDESLVNIRNEMYNNIRTQDPALIIFTTGTTSGIPKPALLQHECIIAQMEITERARNNQSGQELRMMCSLPDSHVGGTTIQPYSAIYSGGTAILLYRFHPVKVMEAIEKWRATWFGAVPTMYRMIWNLPDYKNYDISSLKCVQYAGSIVDQEFIVKLSKMAPLFATSLGMTETAGYVTITPPNVIPGELVGQVGMATDIAKITIREPMNQDGTAGKELPQGEIGEICYHPPLVFLGYFDQPEETAKSISKEGILYSGDLGYFKDMVYYKGLFLKGRSKFMIKQKGYNVFPDDVSNFIKLMPKVADACVTGAKHRLFDEGIIAFVKPEPGMSLTAEEVSDYCQGIASYKRPQHVVILREDEDFPTNRVEKIDQISLNEMAARITEELRQQGKWDVGI